MPIHSELLSAIYAGRAFRSVTDHDEPGVSAGRADLSQYLDAIGRAFYGTKIGYVNEESFAVWRKLIAER